MQARLFLEDGTLFTGKSFGSARDAIGEVVFNTGMTGYQEVLSDPSYCGQFVTMTYPLIGNYGMTREISNRCAPIFTASSFANMNRYRATGEPQYSLDDC